MWAWPLTVLGITIIGAATLVFLKIWHPSGKKLTAQAPPADTPLRDIEVRLKAVEMEWQEFYSKVRRALGRQYRDEALAQAEPAPAVGTKSLTRRDLLLHSRPQ